MSQYKILLVTSFNKPWNNGWFYKEGFEKNGHKVIPFNVDTTENHVYKIIKVVEKVKPDFILHTKNELPAELFHELKKWTKVIHWYPDLAVPEWLPPYVKAADIFFTMAEGRVEEFKRYNPHIFWLTQAFEPSFFYVKNISPTDIKNYSADVSFVGTLGSKKYYLKRREYLGRVLNEDIKFKWWGPRMPRKFSTLPLLLGKLGRAYGGSFVWGEEYAKVAQLSKIFLAFDALPDIRKSMSARMYTAVGCGAFYMCEHVDGIEEVLVPGKEIVTFHSGDEMIDKIKYFLRNDGERMKIAEAGRKRVLKEHTYEIRVRQMLRIIEDVA